MNLFNITILETATLFSTNLWIMKTSYLLVLNILELDCNTVGPSTKCFIKWDKLVSLSMDHFANWPNVSQLVFKKMSLRNNNCVYLIIALLWALNQLFCREPIGIYKPLQYNNLKTVTLSPTNLWIIKLSYLSFWNPLCDILPVDYFDN